MNDKAVYRTATATPGLLIIIYIHINKLFQVAHCVQELAQKCAWTLVNLIIPGGCETELNKVKSVQSKTENKTKTNESLNNSDKKNEHPKEVDNDQMVND